MRNFSRSKSSQSPLPQGGLDGFEFLGDLHVAVFEGSERTSTYTGYLNTVTGRFIRLAASEAWTSAVTSLALWIAAKARYAAS